MRLPNMSEWKVGPPTLRVLALLSLPLATSQVIGACARNRPPEVPQEARGDLAPPKERECSDGGVPADAGVFTVQDGGGFDVQQLCLKHGAQLGFANHSSGPRTLCFVHVPPDGAGVFEDGGRALSASSGTTQQNQLHGRTHERGHYKVCLCDGGTGDPCGFGETGNGTLEVATGNPNEGSDGGQDGKPASRRDVHGAAASPGGN